MTDLDTSLADPLAHSAAPAESSAPDPRLAALAERFGEPGVLTSLLRRVVLDIEAVLSSQITAIIEAPEFREMEARWAGLASVVWAKRNAQTVKVKLLDLDWDEMSRDLHYTSETRRSVLYGLMGAQELDTLGGEPFGIAMLDHGLSMSVETEFDELYTAQLICSLSEAIMCPIITGVANDFFGETDAAWFTDGRRIASVLTSEDYHGWQALRRVSNARFLGIVMPQTQLRGRYEDLDIGFRFHQWPGESEGLWGSGCYDFLRTIIAEFLRCAWFGFLKLVGSVPGQGAVLAPTEHPIPEGCARGGRARIRMTRNLAHIYSELGFIPLAESAKTNMPYFVGNRSVEDCEGSTTREVITQLQSVMIACRIVHYVKVQIRALIGQVKSAAECERILNDWFDPYISSSSGSSEIQARFPLQGARVTVSDAPSDHARFQCEIIVRPQYQIDNVMGDISLRTDFGTPKLGKAA